MSFSFFCEGKHLDKYIQLWIYSPSIGKQIPNIEKKGNLSQADAQTLGLINIHLYLQWLHGPQFLSALIYFFLQSKTLSGSNKIPRLKPYSEKCTQLSSSEKIMLTFHVNCPFHRHNRCLWSRRTGELDSSSLVTFEMDCVLYSQNLRAVLFKSFHRRTAQWMRVSMVILCSTSAVH